MDFGNFTFYESDLFTFPCGDSTMTFNALQILTESYAIATEVWACGRDQARWKSSAPTGFTKLHMIYALLLMVLGILFFI